MITEEIFNKLNIENNRLNDENAKLLAELITLKEENKQLKIKLQKHEARIIENAKVLQL